MITVAEIKRKSRECSSEKLFHSVEKSSYNSQRNILHRRALRKDFLEKISRAEYSLKKFTLLLRPAQLPLLFPALWQRSLPLKSPDLRLRQQRSRATAQSLRGEGEQARRIRQSL